MLLLFSNHIVFVHSSHANTLANVCQLADAMGLFTKCSRMTKQSTKHGVQSLVNVHITDGR